MFLDEIQNNKKLWWAWGALLFAYFTSLSRDPTGVTLNAVTKGTYVCPPYFQDCSWLYFFEWLPYGYSGTIFYMFFFAFMLLAVWFMSRQEWDYVWVATFPIWLWHALLTFVFSDLYNGNYEYYIFVFGTILLFFPHKEFSLKFALVWFYVLSTVTKIHPGWIEGKYFSSLQTGLPLVPDILIPVATKIVIAMEMIGAWFLFSSNKIMQRTALAFFVFFHLYSGILVEYRYPSNVLPMLLIMFGPWYAQQAWPRDKKSIILWSFFALLLFCQFAPRMIEGDEKLTLEGNKYGLYMFEANHQCHNTIIETNSDGIKIDRSWSSVNARNRCDPYRVWYKYKTKCERNPGVQYSWKLDHSINGDPFLRIIDVDSICDLEYTPFRHNNWIKTHADSPEKVGYPAQNIFY